MRRLAGLAAACVLCGASGGCLLAADLINPELLLSLGLNPNTIRPSAGRVIVAFTNRTTQPAEFFAVLVDEANEGTGEISAVVPANESSAHVANCPVRQIIPGQLGDNQAVAQPAVVVNPAQPGAAGGGGTDVAYGGAALQNGVDFFCGDVIEIQLNPVAAAGEGGAAGFALLVRVIPGR